MPLPGDELVDVIDDAGRTVRVVTRREMRKQRLPHRCVYVLVFNGQGQLLIHQRTDTKDVYPAHWDVAVGGVLAAGESFDEGARREGHEELGVEVSPEPLFPFRHEDDLTIVQAMVYRAVHDGPFRFQPEEVVRGDFVSLADLPRLVGRHAFCSDGLAVLRRYQESVDGKSEVG
jgi:isopentenyldiphosphate isomerase